MFRQAPTESESEPEGALLPSLHIQGIVQRRQQQQHTQHVGYYQISISGITQYCTY